MTKYVFELTREEVISTCNNKDDCIHCPLRYGELCAKDLIYDNNNGMRELFKFLLTEVQIDDNV